MTTLLLNPPITSPRDLLQSMQVRGHAALSPIGLCELLPATLSELDALQPSWDDLPPDAYLRDGGRYRRRRHACFVVEGDTVQAVPHRAHWQPLEYNALHGGLERWFEPMRPEVLTQKIAR